MEFYWVETTPNLHSHYARATSAQRIKYGWWTGHKINLVSQSVQYHVMFSEKIEELHFFTCALVYHVRLLSSFLLVAESFDLMPKLPGVQLVQHHHLETPRRFWRTPLNWHKHQSLTLRADFGPSEHLAWSSFMKFKSWSGLIKFNQV